jgi:hypothetical protein
MLGVKHVAEKDVHENPNKNRTRTKYEIENLIIINIIGNSTDKLNKTYRTGKNRLKL